MKRKARIQTGIDDRLVAIYARKSRITNKGDSIGVQFKQSADYAINQLSLPEDYEFARYEDKGLSGYYSDRPDFQRLLRDIEMGKIKAVACYKLDRISRKTSDLMRLLEYFERHDVTLLVCSNNINTRISTSKIIIQVLAIIAEFERDILTERIQDNLMELAKDGRWLGGKTPTGFSSQRVTTGSGKNKSAISFLVPVQEEKEIVLEIYGTFWETRSLLQTANIINEKYETKHGAKFTTSTIRLILRNPIYCVADEYSYNYFLEHDGNLFGEPSDFDGQHGLTAYNKTDQMKVEDEDSTFFNPKFSQLLTRKPISEWIVSVGRHEGFISSRKWVETQNMLDEIAEKYNRPHRKTNALLSGLMYCPICGKRLRVLPESNRWTNGKPRFKYACPGVRAKECTFKGVEGVTLDEFVIHSLSSLQEEHSDYYRQLLENRVASMIRTDQSEKEYQETKKAIERLNADIAAQVRNLREADDALKRFIQDDIKELTDELAKREAALRRMEDTQSENQYLIHELNGMKKRLLSFEEFAKGAQPEALFTLVHSIVDRIYITTDGTKQKCQVYIKGCATEDYSDVLGAAGYIEEEPLLPVASYVPPMCDLDYYSIGDIVISEDEYILLKAYLRSICRKYLNTSERYITSPIFAVALVQIGIHKYDGRFWPHVEREIGMELPGSYQKWIGRSFYKTLEKYNKYKVAENEMMNNILLHCFITNYYASDLFVFLFAYYQIDLERDLTSNSKEMRDYLMQSMASGENTARAYKIKKHTSDAVAFNTRGCKIRVGKILRFMDNALFYGLFPRTSQNRIAQLFCKWADESKKFDQAKKAIAGLTKRGEKRYCSPYLRYNGNQNRFELVLPPQ